MSRDYLLFRTKGITAPDNIIGRFFRPSPDTQEKYKIATFICGCGYHIFLNNSYLYTILIDDYEELKYYEKNETIVTLFRFSNFFANIVFYKELS